MKKEKDKEKTIIIIENTDFKFETGKRSNRNEFNIIDGIHIINPLHYYKNSMK